MSSSAHRDLPADPVARALSRARSVLPDQGPIGVFIHHNTLHAFQHLPFHEGVRAGADALGAEPYLTLAAFRRAAASGRIARDDLEMEVARALGDRAGELVFGTLTRAGLWLELLCADVDSDDAAGLEFALGAGEARECDDLARWVVRALLADALASHAARALVRHARLLAADRRRRAGSPPGALARQLALLLRGFAEGTAIEPLSPTLLSEVDAALARLAGDAALEDAWLDLAERLFAPPP